MVIRYSLSLAAGGGVRVAIEDNIWLDDARTKLASNSDLLKRVHPIAKANGRELITPREFRIQMNLQADNGSYGRNN